MGTDGRKDVLSTGKSVREGRAQSLQRTKSSGMISLERSKHGLGQE